jgi:hypothetical protein
MATVLMPVTKVGRPDHVRPVRTMTLICVSQAIASNAYKMVDERGSGRVNQYVLSPPEGELAVLHRVAATAAALACLLTLAGCQDGGVTKQPGTPTTTTPSTPTSNVDARALPALRAYRQFIAASQNAKRKPVAQGEKYPRASDFNRWSFDPARAEYETYIWSLALGDVEFRGTPPQSHARVEEIDLDASPYPTVHVSDCQTGGNWVGYDTKLGKVLPTPKPSVAPPYLSKSTVIYFRKRWGVSTIKVDTSRTCTAES